MYALIPQNCEFVTLYGKKDFADVIKNFGVWCHLPNKQTLSPENLKEKNWGG